MSPEVLFVLWAIAVVIALAWLAIAKRKPPTNGTA